MIPQAYPPLHLVDAGPEREALAAFRIMSSAPGAMIAQKFGLTWPGYWCLLNVDCRGPSGLPKPLEGEIDVILGPIEGVPTTDSLEEMSKWAVAGCPPLPSNGKAVCDLSKLVALEVKCSFVDAEPIQNGRGPINKSTKVGKLGTLRKQLIRNRTCGFGSVGFVQVIAGTAISTKSIVAAIHSFAVATRFLPEARLSVTPLLNELSVPSAITVVSPTLWGEDAYTGGILFEFDSKCDKSGPVNTDLQTSVQEFVTRQLQQSIQLLIDDGGLLGVPLIVNAGSGATLRHNQRPPRILNEPTGDDTRSIAVALDGVRVPPGGVLFICVPEGITVQRPAPPD